jgi:MoaA/NifB/PqqE/SkfB family radical SAM enzyme
MCSIWKNGNKKIVKFEDAKKALIKLHKNNFGTIQITGGEPLLNPDIFHIIEYAKKLGFTIFLVTNGTLIDESAAKKLSEIGVDNVGISFHHYDKIMCEKIFGHKDVFNKLVNSVKFLKKEKIPVEALFTISKYNKNDIEKTIEFINSKLDISVSFCMPTTIKNTSFSLGNESVDFEKDELKEIILEIIRLKKKGYKIINNMIFLKEALNFLDGKNKYYCLGGYKIFYLDWNLDLYPCMFKGKPTSLDEKNFKFEKLRCNECLLQCFREPSLFLRSKGFCLKLIMKQLPEYLRFINS